jgi:HAD superfamily hydrolase (TIGR01549 family)
VRTPRAVIFDFGNTLFAHALLADTLLAAATAQGAAITAKEATACAARIESAAQSTAERALGRDLDAEVWESQWRRLYSAADRFGKGLGDEVYRRMHAPEEWVPYRETEATLRRLHRHGVHVGVLSNTGWDVRSVFRRHGYEAWIDAFGLSYELGEVKPSPAAFTAMCALLGTEPRDVVMVGDDVIADAGAAHAGLRTLLLPVAAPGADNGISLAATFVGAE